MENTEKVSALEKLKQAEKQAEEQAELKEAKRKYLEGSEPERSRRKTSPKIITTKDIFIRNIRNENIIFELELSEPERSRRKTSPEIITTKLSRPKESPEIIAMKRTFTKHKKFVLKLIEKNKFDLVQSYFNSVFVVAKDTIPLDENSFNFFMKDAGYIKYLLEDKENDMLIFENYRQNLIDRVSEFFSLDKMVSYVGADWIENKRERLSNFDSCGILNRALLNFAKGWSKELDPEIQEIVSGLVGMQNCWKPTTKTLEEKISNLRDNANHNQNRGKSNKFWIGSSIFFGGASVASAVCALLVNPFIFGIASGILGICAVVSIYNASNKSNDSKHPNQVR